MPQTDILKLIFHHDQRMEQLAPAEESGTDADVLASFMKPDPTYSTMYFSGTDLEAKKFGLDKISAFEEVVQILDTGFGELLYFSKSGKKENLKEAIDSVEINEAIVVSAVQVEPEIIHSFSGKVLRDILEKGWVVIYKVEAEDGFDLNIFSRENIYTNFFYKLQALLPETFRFFSINGKRVSSEKQFYFETWSLHKPPHGFEEVFPESVL